MSDRGSGQKQWWTTGLLVTLAGLVFSAGGLTYTTRSAVAEHAKCIEALQTKAAEAKEAMARTDERFKAISDSLTRIEKRLDSKE